jgi:cytochrome b561
MAVIIIYTLIAGFISHLVNPIIFNTLSVLNMSLATVAVPIFCFRYIWSFFRVTPELPLSIPKWQKQSAKLIHSLLYLIIFGVFISGYLMLKVPFQFFWLVTINNPISDIVINTFFFKLHIMLCIFLSFMVSIHILAALKHKFYNQNNVLELMFPVKK